jgi:hypothetical protein
MAFSPDSKTLATGTDHGQLQLWDVTTGKRLRDFPAHPRAIQWLDIQTHYRALLNGIGISPEDMGGKTTFLGEGPIFDSVHRIGACIGIPIMAAAAGAATAWRMRTGRGGFSLASKGLREYAEAMRR